MHSPAPSYSKWRSSWQTGLGLLLVLTVLSGCPANKLPKPFSGSDNARVQHYTYAGIPVVQVQDQRPYVHLEIQVRRGASDIRGLEGLVVESAIQGGAGNLGPGEYQRAVEQAGIVLDHTEHESHVAVRMRCLPEHLKAGFKLLSQAFLDPKMEGKAVQAMIASQKAHAFAEKEALEAQVDGLLRGAAFAGTAAESPWQPSSAMLGGVDGPYLRQLAVDRLFFRCNIALVVTGPVDAEFVNDLLYETLDQLPEGDCATPVAPSMQVGKVLCVQSESQVQAISGAFPAPSPGLPDAFPIQAAADLLSARLRARLVDGMKLALAVDVRYVPCPPAHLRLDIVSPRPLQAAELALSEIRKLRDLGISEAGLDSAKSWMVAERQMALESASSWAQQAGIAEATGGWPNFGNPKERAAALRPAHIQFVMQKYLHGVSWAIVGDTTRIDRKSLLRL